MDGATFSIVSFYGIELLAPHIHTFGFGFDFDFWFFLSPQPVVLPKLKSPICPTIYW